MSQKDIYPYECKDIWQRFDETSLPGMKEFYNNLTMEEITDAH